MGAWDMVARMLAATLLSGAVGWERERGERAAGLRTHAMVGLGACLFMIVSAHGFPDFQSTSGPIPYDTSRIAAQVVSGVGFLGAGAIIFQREVVRGLTTAASIWIVAAIGLAAGGGLYLEAAVGTVIGLGVLAGLKPIERRFFTHHRTRRLSLLLDRQATHLGEALSAARTAGLRIHAVHLRPSDHDDLEHLDLLYEGKADGAVDLAADHLSQLPGVRVLSFQPSGLPANGAPTRMA